MEHSDREDDEYRKKLCHAGDDMLTLDDEEFSNELNRLKKCPSEIAMDVLHLLLDRNENFRKELMIINKLHELTNS